MENIYISNFGQIPEHLRISKAKQQKQYDDYRSARESLEKAHKRAIRIEISNELFNGVPLETIQRMIKESHPEVFI